MLKHLLRKIYKIQGGLEPLPEDERDLGFSLESLFGAGYTPKEKEKYLELPFEPKRQYFNTCGWTASAGAKEYDEQVELEEQSLIMFGKEKGLISGDGFSNLRSNEIVLQESGIAEKSVCSMLPKVNNWERYSNTSLLSKAIRENAAIHKTKSFSQVTSVESVYKAIDEGRPVKIGTDWRTNFNMGGGFSFPWILNFLKGLSVGGHATFVYGYNQEYRGVKAFKVRNSFGSSYGDNGDFWITEKDLAASIKRYGAYTNLDLDKGTLKWLASHQGVVVKTDKSPDVFLVQGDKKRKFADLATFYAHGKTEDKIITVQDYILNDVKEGAKIEFWDGGNVSTIKTMIQQNKNLKAIFDKYFKELFK